MAGHDRDRTGNVPDPAKGWRPADPVLGAGAGGEDQDRDILVPSIS